jgi:ribosomal protein L11 methylase PrmA
MSLGDPYVPTPPELVRAKLEFGEVTEHDVVFDLGCGDGRVLIMACLEYGARAVGVDIQTGVVEEAWAEVAEHHLDDQIEIRCEDYFDTDLQTADLIVLYLTTRTLHSISGKLEEVRSGTRIVTHDYPLSGWDLTEQTTFTDDEGRVSPLFLYVRG